MSGVSKSSIERAKIATWLAPKLIGPVRFNAYCRPIMPRWKMFVDCVIQGRDIDLIDQANLQMVLEVFADARKRLPGLDTSRRQNLWVANARDLKDLR